MNKYLLLFGVVLSPLWGYSQDVTTEHDEMKMKQILAMEQGGALSGNLFYEAYPSYKKTASVTNKAGLRVFLDPITKDQIDYADSIKTRLKERASEDALSLADMTPARANAIGGAWYAEGEKIEKKMQEWLNLIGMIIVNGGTIADKQDWEEQYKCTEMAIKETRSAWQSNAKRQEALLAIYSDICRYIHTLQTKQKVDYCYSKMDMFCSTPPTIKRANVATVINACKSRWDNVGYEVLRGNTKSRQMFTNKK